jgi:stalled ribosome rescue protein Dom34
LKKTSTNYIQAKYKAMEGNTKIFSTIIIENLPITFKQSTKKLKEIPNKFSAIIIEQASNNYIQAMYEAMEGNTKQFSTIIIEQTSKNYNQAMYEAMEGNTKQFSTITIEQTSNNYIQAKYETMEGNTIRYSFDYNTLNQTLTITSKHGMWQ